MVTVSIPEWVVWVIIATFFFQWFMNGLVAYYKNKSARSYESLQETIKSIAKSSPLFNSANGKDGYGNKGGEGGRGINGGGNGERGGDAGQPGQDGQNGRIA